MGRRRGKVFAEDEGGDRTRILVVGDMRPSESGALLGALRLSREVEGNSNGQWAGFVVLQGGAEY
jgi:hypothetical protein